MAMINAVCKRNANIYRVVPRLLAQVHELAGHLPIEDRAEVAALMRESAAELLEVEDHYEAHTTSSPSLSGAISQPFGVRAIALFELMKTNPKLRLEQPADETIVIGGTRPLPVTE